MKNFLFFCVPPLVGAVIGFITNVLAIKMLFRPLRPYYLFGLRIPFTPGILPRERARLAESIGAMVERELLTPEILRERLAGEELREKFSRSLSKYAGTLPGLFQGAAEKLYPRVLEALAEFLQKPEIRGELEKMGRGLVDNIVDDLPPIQRIIITSGQFTHAIKENMPLIIGDLIDKLVEAGRRGETRDRLIAYAGDKLFRAGTLEDALRDLFQPAAKSGNLERLVTERLFAAADSHIEKILGAIDIRTVVRDRINRMEMLRVEKIILDVMANQLKWIDVFGAILGFLIGLFQVLFSWSMRG
ncbi:MAG: DUF445 family protein [Treponema sp.]|jgi:uncharacterized membrane-anchored protein YjiN (DUF445 family)|nr:DUF445 family protein [Treponema sp.]